eukprot:972569_1
MLGVCVKLDESTPVRSFSKSAMEFVRAAACAKSSTEIDFEGIGWRQLRSRAAQMAVAGLARELSRQHSKSSTNFISCMLNDAKGCVRSSVLKELLRIVKSSGADSRLNAFLDVPQLTSHLFGVLKCFVERQKNVADISVVLELLAEMKDYIFRDESATRSFDWDHYWKSLVCVASQAGIRERVQALRLLGMCLGSKIRTDSQSESLTNYIHDWIGILKMFSGDEMPADLRDACSDSISESQLLSSKSLAPAMIIDVWIILINLLQDSEMVIRSEASRVACDALADGKRQNARSLMPTRTLCLVFDHLVERFWTENSLITSLWEAAFEPWLQTDSSESSKSGVAKSKLFNKEKANDHFEPVVMAQLVSKAMIGIFNRRSNDAYPHTTPMSSILPECFASISKIIAQFSQSAVAHNWGSDRSVECRFERLYVQCVAVWTVVVCARVCDDQSLITQIRQAFPVQNSISGGILADTLENISQVLNADTSEGYEVPQLFSFTL